MTADIVNLNRARKAKKRADKERRAEENRVRHGRTKAERRGEEARRAREAARLDGARRETTGEDPLCRRGEGDLDPGSVS